MSVNHKPSKLRRLLPVVGAWLLGAAVVGALVLFAVPVLIVGIVGSVIGAALVVGTGWQYRRHSAKAPAIPTPSIPSEVQPLFPRTERVEEIHDRSPTVSPIHEVTHDTAEVIVPTHKVSHDTTDVMLPVLKRVDEFERCYANADGSQFPIHHVLQLDKQANISDCIKTCGKQITAWHEDHDQGIKAIYQLEAKDPRRQRTHAIFSFFKNLYAHLKEVRNDNTAFVLPSLRDDSQTVNTTSDSTDIMRRYDDIEAGQDKIARDQAEIRSGFVEIRRDQKKNAHGIAEVASGFAEARRILAEIKAERAAQDEAMYKLHQAAVIREGCRWSIFGSPQQIDKVKPHVSQRLTETPGNARRCSF